MEKILDIAKYVLWFALGASIMALGLATQGFYALSEQIEANKNSALANANNIKVLVNLIDAIDTELDLESINLRK